MPKHSSNSAPSSATATSMPTGNTLSPRNTNASTLTPTRTSTA
ncbi:hypothetical protein WKI71_45705 [Streptomyces sp. MS1.AVA.1]|uniref:Uncharacterized protein n=1 Tax=Streptomyces machairae TaxID=3134109 RepID=A0ABU8UVY6_9ACTN